MNHNNLTRFATESGGCQVTGALGVGTTSVGATSGELRATNEITAYYSSDERLKTDIKPIEDPLAKVLSISGNTFTWKAGHVVHSGEDTGVIAQEIEKLGLPGVVTTRDSGYKAVKYEKLVPLLIEAIKELKNEVDELKKGK